MTSDTKNLFELKKTLSSDEFVIYDSTMDVCLLNEIDLQQTKLTNKKNLIINNNCTSIFKSLQTFALFSVIFYQIWPKYFFNAFIGYDM